jgi:hypothetical protein
MQSGDITAIVSGFLALLPQHEEFPMAQEINEAFRLPGWRIGDPPVLLEAILSQVEGEQAKQVTALYLDSVTATLEANLKFVQGLRSVIAGGAAKR